MATILIDLIFKIIHLENKIDNFKNEFLSILNHIMQFPIFYNNFNYSLTSISKC